MTALTDFNGTYVLDTAHTEIGFTARPAMSPAPSSSTSSSRAPRSTRSATSAWA